jgi:hypothetical protein
MPVNTNFPPLTVENYKLLPETGPRYQLIQGDLYMAPAPNRFHQEISRNLEFELQGYLKRNPIGKLFDAPFDVYLDEINVFQPTRHQNMLRDHRGFRSMIFFPRSYPMSVRIFARTSASSSADTAPFRLAFRLRQSRLFT